MDELKEYVIKLQKEYNALEIKCDKSARELKDLIDMNLKAINVIQCCKSDSEQLVCDECGDTGIGYPTLQEPDGAECDKCRAN